MNSEVFKTSKEAAFAALISASQAYSEIYSSYMEAYKNVPELPRNYGYEDAVKNIVEAHTVFSKDKTIFIDDQSIMYYFYISEYDKIAKEALNEAKKASQADPSNTSKTHAFEAAKKNFTDLNKAFLPMKEAYTEAHRLVMDFSTKANSSKALALEARKAARDALPKTK